MISLLYYMTVFSFSFSEGHLNCRMWDYIAVASCELATHLNKMPKAKSVAFVTFR